MSLKNKIFQILILVVTLTHCLNIYYPSFLEVNEIEENTIELEDIDPSESGSEEKEEELKAFDTNKFQSLVFYLIQGDFSKSHFYWLEKIQAPFLSIVYSPPETKI